MPTNKKLTHQPNIRKGNVMETSDHNKCITHLSTLTFKRNSLINFEEKPPPSPKFAPPPLLPESTATAIVQIYRHRPGQTMLPSPKLNTCVLEILYMPLMAHQ